MVTKASGSKYAEYAAITMLTTIGVLGMVEFSGVAPLSFVFAIGAVLATLGIYTLAYLYLKHSDMDKPLKNYMLVWGYLTGAAGISLVLSSVINLLFALSASLIGLAVVTLLILRI